MEDLVLLNASQFAAAFGGSAGGPLVRGEVGAGEDVGGRAEGATEMEGGGEETAVGTYAKCYEFTDSETRHIQLVVRLD